jgi:hypothetical protein
MRTTTALVAATLVLCVSALSAQRAARPSRDLSGYWTNGTITPLQRPAELATKDFFTPAEATEYERTWLENFHKNFSPDDLQAPDIDYTYMDRMKVIASRRTSLITDPPDGKLPAQVDAAKARAAARPKKTNDDPELLGLDERCLLSTAFGTSNASPPMVPNPFAGNFYQIVQTADHVMIYTELVHDARVIRIGGTHAPPAVQLWLGDSIGRWDGDTLVVDTTNFTEKSHFRGSSTKLHVVERFTRINPTTIRYQFTADDPDTWERPWSAEVPFDATTERIHEYACHEGNYSMTNVLRGARAEEKQKEAKQKD